MKTILVGVALLMTAVSAQAEHIQCGGGFLDIGSSSSELIVKCGQPLDRSIRDNISGSYRQFNTKRIEEWTYVINGFVRVFKVVDGKIVSMSTGSKAN